ncbi:MAG: hypothetical protein ABEK02_02355 [Haloquadratum sp.]
MSTGSDRTGPVDGRGESRAAGDESAATTPTTAASETASTTQIRAAIDEIRREVRKAAAVHAAVDAALVALVANLVLELVGPAWLTRPFGPPAVVGRALRDVIGGAAPTALTRASLVAVALGTVAFALEFALRLRRPLVEQFEAANPPVREALRTARDAVTDGSDTEMARRLYADVLKTLGRTSSRELVGTRRVAVTALLVVLVSLASVQVAVVDPTLPGLFDGGDGDGGDTTTPPADGDLRDADPILGEAEDVQAGDELENITVPGTGEGIGEGPTAPSGGFGGGGGTGEYESQQAGFGGTERIEDAELVREYNLRIREFEEQDGTATDATRDETTRNDATN